jgi:hypothetical protein
MVAFTRMPSIERYGGVGPDATKHTLRWRGTTSAPPTFGVMVACVATPPLHLEQWREIGGVENPGQQRRNRHATNGLFYTSVSTSFVPLG